MAFGPAMRLKLRPPPCSSGWRASTSYHVVTHSRTKLPGALFESYCV